MANALRLKTGGHYLIYWTRSRSRDELNYSRSLAGPPDHAARADNASRAIRDISMYGLRVRTELDPGDWPDAPGGDPDVVVRVEPPAPATFEGARYKPQGLFRPTFRCMMRNTQDPFCPVCSQHILARLQA